MTSKGLEIDLVGDLSELWTFQANYAYNDARITGGGPGSIGLAVGDRFPNAPKQGFGLWTRHQIPALNSAIAGGVDYVGERVSIDGQKVRAYTTTDLSWKQVETLCAQQAAGHKPPLSQNPVQGVR